MVGRQHRFQILILLLIWFAECFDKSFVIWIKFFFNQEKSKRGVYIHQTTELDHDLFSQSIFCCCCLLVFGSFLCHECVKNVIDPIKDSIYWFSFWSSIWILSHSINIQAKTFNIILFLLQKFDPQLIKPGILSFHQQIFNLLIRQRFTQIHQINERCFTYINMFVFILDFVIKLSNILSSIYGSVHKSFVELQKVLRLVQQFFHAWEVKFRIFLDIWFWGDICNKKQVLKSDIVWHFVIVFVSWWANFLETR